MKWHSPLYVGDSLRDRKAEVTSMIEDGSCDPRIRIVTLASNGQDLLDIRQGAGWAARCAEADQPLILGIAGSRREALQLVQMMVEECWLLQGNADLRQFFSEDE